MYLTWRSSTMLFVLSLAAGTVIYHFFGYRLALVASGLVTAVTGVMSGVLYAKTGDLEHLIHALVACMATAAVLCLGCFLLPPQDFVFAATICAGFVICISAALAERTRAFTGYDTPLALLALTGFPLGIGTAVGGVVLIQRLARKRRLAAGRKLIESMSAQAPR